MPHGAFSKKIVLSKSVLRQNRSTVPAEDANQASQAGEPIANIFLWQRRKNSAFLHHLVG
jgi:hypothetical protein